jgi:ABC-type amino acid transport substrate-binding protein
MRRRLLAMVVVGLATTFVACGPPTPRVPRGGNALRVGVTADSPPFVLIQGGQGGKLAGLEVDFALELGRALGRPVEFIDLEWNDQIRALQAGRTDIIMSGMSVTPARQVAIAFSQPYLRSGLATLVRREDAQKFPDVMPVTSCSVRIGVVAGTTGARWAHDRCPGGLAVYTTTQSAIDELRTRRIDAVIQDGPILGWYASRGEADFMIVRPLLTNEPLAWGMRLNDERLRAAVDAALARWMSDGTRDRILGRWVPYWRQLEAAPGARR